MFFVPFIYFTLLTAYWWRKHRAYDICVYMSSLYAVTSFFEIVVVCGDMLGEGGILFGKTDLELGVVPTLLFCVVHTLGMLPFSLVYKTAVACPDKGRVVAVCVGLFLLSQHIDVACLAIVLLLPLF